MKKARFNGILTPYNELILFFNKKLLVDCYLTKKQSLGEISKNYKISLDFIKYCFSLYGIQMRDVKERNKLSVSKSIETCIKRYGVKRPLMNKSIKKKADDTLFKNYGVIHNMKDKTILKKSQDTLFKNYGVYHPFDSKEIINKSIRTCNQRYGKDFATQTTQQKDKSRRTCKQRYGVEFTLQLNRVRKNIHHKYEYDNKKFDSILELSYYIWLKDKNIDFIYQPNIKLEYEVDSVKHYYFPDFKVEDKLIEIKGDHFFDENNKLIDPYDRSNDKLAEKKQEVMLRNKVMILREQQCQVYLDYMKNKFGKKYKELFKSKIITH